MISQQIVSVRFVAKYEELIGLTQFGNRSPSIANKASSIHPTKALELPDVIRDPEHEVSAALDPIPKNARRI